MDMNIICGGSGTKRRRQRGAETQVMAMFIGDMFF